MRAITIQQPGAELILQGRKTFELRTWAISHRGRIAIHAGKRVKTEAGVAHGLDADSLPRGALVGTVDIMDVTEFDQASWQALRDQHLSPGDFPGDVVGWQLANPQRLPQPIPWRGRMGIFYVDDEALSGISPPPRRLAAYDAHAERPEDRPFELRVVPRDGEAYGLALYQLPIAANGEKGQELQRLVELGGTSLQAVVDHVLEALRKTGHKGTDLIPSRRRPFYLDEETGVRLGLLFLAVRPISKLSRIEHISLGVRAMPSEEAYYWFSKCTAQGSGRRAQQALRILLAGE